MIRVTGSNTNEAIITPFCAPWILDQKVISVCFFQASIAYYHDSMIYWVPTIFTRNQTTTIVYKIWAICLDSSRNWLLMQRINQSFFCFINFLKLNSRDPKTINRCGTSTTDSIIFAIIISFWYWIIDWPTKYCCNQSTRASISHTIHEVLNRKFDKRTCMYSKGGFHGFNCSVSPARTTLALVLNIVKHPAIISSPKHIFVFTLWFLSLVYLSKLIIILNKIIEVDIRFNKTKLITSLRLFKGTLFCSFLSS